MLGLLGARLRPHGGVWAAVGTLSDNFDALGFAVIGVFVAAWLTSIVVYRLKGYDKLDVTIGGSAPTS